MEHNICSSSVWNLLHAALLAPITLRWRLDFFFESLHTPGLHLAFNFSRQGRTVGWRTKNCALRAGSRVHAPSFRVFRMFTFRAVKELMSPYWFCAVPLASPTRFSNFRPAAWNSSPVDAVSREASSEFSSRSVVLNLVPAPQWETCKGPCVSAVCSFEFFCLCYNVCYFAYLTWRPPGLCIVCDVSYQNGTS